MAVMASQKTDYYFNIVSCGNMSKKFVPVVSEVTTL